jgi:hypothetical protein
LTNCDVVTGEVAFDFCIGARWVPLGAPEAGPRPLAVLDPQSLATGIRYASTLIGRKSTPNFPCEGIQIKGGSIFGAYPYGFSRYRSPSLPESLTLNLAKDHVANARALFRRLGGQEVLETDSHVYIRAQNIEGSWTRMRSWSPSHVLAVNRLFESSPLRTVLIETPLLQRATRPMVVLFEKIQVTVEDRGADARVVMSGLSKIEGARRIWQGSSCATGRTTNDLGTLQSMLKICTTHMWTAPLCGRHPPRKSFWQCFDQIACVHMSGLLSRSHVNAGQDGFRGASSKQRRDP